MQIRHITFHTPKNYGAVLQAFSLHKCLKKLCPDTKLIDFDTQHLRELYPVIPKGKSAKQLVKNSLMLSSFKKKKKKYKKFDDFVKSKFDMTEKYSSYEQLCLAPAVANVYFTGSDQVFNPNRIKSERQAFYLDFAPKGTKRCAYAASFGVAQINEKRQQEIRSYLEKFDRISVREKNGVDIVSQNSDKQATLVADPVFLNDKDFWKEQMTPYRVGVKNYVLYYRLLNEKHSDNAALKIAQSLSKKLVVITDDMLRIKADKVLRDVGPREFLYLYDNADYIVTDSFHGVAFSLIFNKQFVCLPIRADKMHRQQTLLENVGLTDRIYSNDFKDYSIDYNNVNINLEKLKNEAMDYLISCIPDTDKIEKRKIETIRDICTGCTACVNSCPKDCIAMVTGEQYFSYPLVDYSKCISCGACDRVCPCLKNDEQRHENRKSYYGWNSNKKTRFESTSGGAFSALAQKVLDSSGNVYGVAFDYDNLTAIHTSTDKVGLAPLLKSKYVQSDLSDCCRQVKSDLQADRQVLFCGTPCQVAGLVSFLNKDYSNLITCDFVCHGVPPMGLLKKHIRDVLPSGKIKSIDFRSKADGWSGQYGHLCIKGEKGTYKMPHRLDKFYAGFYDDRFLRKCCYDCKYTNTHFSDITIADFWGYKKLDKTLNDEKGISLVVTHTQKAQEFLADVTGFEFKEIDNSFSAYAFERKNYEQAKKKREQFYEKEKAAGFSQAATQLYLGDRKIELIKYKIKKHYKKMQDIILHF